jgi:hypothetical protein
MRALTLLLLTTTFCNLQAQTPSWRHSAGWDDGKAEYGAYTVEWPRYGKVFPGEATLIVVKEPWAPDLDVKADAPRADGFEVLKLNHLRTVPTGIYTYQQIASAFVRRDDGSLVKLATSSFEACGLTTTEMVDGEWTSSSYFDGQGRQRRSWPLGALPEDALPLMLRDFVVGAVPETIEVVPSVLTGRLPELTTATYLLSRGLPRQLTVPAGTFEVVRLSIEGRRSSRHLDFELAPPHRLVAMELADGTTYRLLKSDRLAYWDLNQPGDEAWWPQPAVAPGASAVQP